MAHTQTIAHDDKSGHSKGHPGFYSQNELLLRFYKDDF